MSVDRLPAIRQPTDVLHGELVDAAATPGRIDLTRWLANHQPSAVADVGLLHDLAGDVARFAKASRAAGTIRKYDAGWDALLSWCARFGFDPGPPTPIEVVALYLAQMVRDDLAISTQDGRLAAIRDRHLAAGLLPPTDDLRFRRVRDGVRRLHGRPVEGKAAVTLPLLAAMLATRPAGPPPGPDAPLEQRREHLAALRDRCLLSLGFFAGLRREELAGLPVDHVQPVQEGLRLLIARSKADQTGRGRRVDLPEAPTELAAICPVRTTVAWLDAAGRREHLHRPGRRRTGAIPVLSGISVGARVRATALNDRYVAETVKQAARDAGQPPEVVETLAGHSLRAGLATALEAAGVPQSVIARILGHATGTTGRYVRHAFDGAAHDALYIYATRVLGSI